MELVPNSLRGTGAGVLLLPEGPEAAGEERAERSWRCSRLPVQGGH